jgi:hypothetical protein
MPDHTILPINCNAIIGYAGALHCIVMQVPGGNQNPVVTVTAPNGGESIYAGDDYDITWTATDDVAVTFVDIYLSTNGGGSYPTLIAAGEADDGAFTWTTPDTVAESCRVKVIAHDADGNTGEDTSNADFRIQPIPQLAIAFNLDNDPGWGTEGLWAFGEPQGGGSHAGDPPAAYTGTNVYGFNLFGDYASNMPRYYLQTGEIDCSDLSYTELRFWRWLGVESSDSDSAVIQISTDRERWTSVWSNPAADVNDDAWTPQKFDISGSADGMATVYIRWGIGPTDGANEFPGWNIDDIEIWGVRSSPGPGDLDHDGDADLADYALFADCLAGPDVSTPPAGCDSQMFVEADLSGDGDVDLGDFEAFQRVCEGP